MGSSSYITNLDAQIVQHVEYVPFGEVFIEERNQSWNTPYLFNGKELDEETGLYYYGARYYNPRESVWLSVDPRTEKYPGISPYIYMGQNPVKYIDPEGMEPIKPEAVTIKGFVKTINTTGTKLGLKAGKSAHSAMLLLGVTKFDWGQGRPMPVYT
ncbi:RHS repeat domain-containing protein [Apibacter adventoris]|uniref:RHS repeat domain-containing protein n=1 Tax=Apibacter adventoris TaxID=1679466 RepID=UPI0021A42BAB|nr:RHS repeat-associated core domain-containing protein [Apibacter adventoris]